MDMTQFEKLWNDLQSFTDSQRSAVLCFIFGYLANDRKFHEAIEAGIRSIRGGTSSSPSTPSAAVRP